MSILPIWSTQLFSSVHARDAWRCDCLLLEPHSPLRWRINGRDSVSNHQPHDCLLNRLFRRKSEKTSKLRVTGLCAGNSPGTGEFPAQMASNAENVSIWWRHHAMVMYCLLSRRLWKRDKKVWVTSPLRVGVINSLKEYVFLHSWSLLCVNRYSETCP